MNNYQIKEGDIVEGRITGIQPYGIFVKLSDECSGLIHASELEKLESTNPSRFFKIGQQLKVKVLRVKPGGTQVVLKIYRGDSNNNVRRVGASNFETINGFNALEKKMETWVQEAKDNNWI